MFVADISVLVLAKIGRENVCNWKIKTFRSIRNRYVHFQL